MLAQQKFILLYNFRTEVLTRIVVTNICNVSPLLRLRIPRDTGRCAVLYLLHIYPSKSCSTPVYARLPLAVGIPICQDRPPPPSHFVSQFIPVKYNVEYPRSPSTALILH